MGPEGAAHKHLYISSCFSLAVLLLVQLIVTSSQVLILIQVVLSRKCKKKCAFSELPLQPLHCSYGRHCWSLPPIGLSLLTSSPFSCHFSGSCYPLILCPVPKWSSTVSSFVSVSILEVEGYISVHPALDSGSLVLCAPWVLKVEVSKSTGRSCPSSFSCYWPRAATTGIKCFCILLELLCRGVWASWAGHSNVEGNSSYWFDWKCRKCLLKCRNVNISLTNFCQNLTFTKYFSYCCCWKWQSSFSQSFLTLFWGLVSYTESFGTEMMIMAV